MWGNPSNFYFSKDIQSLKENPISKLVDYAENKFEFQSYSIQNQIITFRVLHVFFFSYQSTLQYKIKGNTFLFTFSVQYQKLINFLLVYVLASALFSTFSVVFFLWFSCVSIVIIGVVQYIMLYNIFSSMIDSIDLKENLEETISTEQKLWIENPSLCPACGSKISPYHTNCNECGLFLQNVKPFSRFTLSEDLQNYSIQYKITDEKN